MTCPNQAGFDSFKLNIFQQLHRVITAINTTIIDILMSPDQAQTTSNVSVFKKKNAKYKSAH